MSQGYRMLLVCAAIGASSCSTYRPGRQAPPQTAVQITSKYLLGIVEFDDQGWFYSRSDAQRVVDSVATEAASGGAIIVVFVHGWHHSARPHDSNLECFKKTLERLHDEMMLPVYADARQRLFGRRDGRIVGVYIGWRGQSLPGRLDYLTFWDRKAAALRVGHGDFPELLMHLDGIYRSANKQQGNFAGLTIMGHSFGGQVLFAAVSDVLKTRIANVVATAGGDPNETPELTGIGDLIILVNPAAEASAYNSIDQLVRYRRFLPEQRPVFMVVSSEADKPNKGWFPVGRVLGTRHEPHGSNEQYSQKIHALGWYRPQITHCLAMASGTSCTGFVSKKVVQRQPCRPQKSSGVPPLSAGTSSECQEPLELDVRDAIDNAGVWCERDLHNPAGIMLSGELGLVGARLYRVDDSIDPNDPFLVVKATSEVVRNHNDMFNSKFVNFLIRYGAGVLLKRVGFALQDAAP